MGSFAVGNVERRPKALILIENLPVDYDRRVKAEARSLIANGFLASVICPASFDVTPADPQKGMYRVEGSGQLGAAGSPDRRPEEEPLCESLDGVFVRRYRPRPASGGARSQVAEYLVALVKTLWLMIGLARSPGFDVIQACNPPDLFFLVSWPFKLAGKRFVFDQHDPSPELYSTLYGATRVRS